MIGYAPFLGQVRLIRPHLAQSETTEENIAIANRNMDRFEALARELPQAPRVAILSKILECRVLADRLRDVGDNIPTLNEALDKVKACTVAVEKQIDAEVARLQSPPPGAAPSAPVPTSSVQSSEGVPTWAWAVGGVVAAGLVAFMATR